MAHTLGPWESSGWVFAGEGKESILIACTTGGHIARLFTPNGPLGCNSLAPPDPKTCEANAYLLAAAPELLEALETLVALIPKTSLIAESLSYRQAKAAIAKAKGG